MAATVLQLLEPAIDGLFLGRPVQIWGLITIAPAHALTLIPLIIVGAGLVWTIAALGQAALVNRIGHGIVGDIQVRLFGSMIRADLARLRAGHSGGFVSSVLFDANLVREAFTNGVVNYTQHALTLVAVLAYMAWSDWRLTLIVFLGAPLIAWIIRRFGKRMRKATTGAMVETSNLSTALMENLDGVRVIKIENREAEEEARVGEVVARRQRHVIKSADSRAFAGPFSNLVAMMVVAAVMAYAGWQARQGERRCLRRLHRPADGRRPVAAPGHQPADCPVRGPDRSPPSVRGAGHPARDSGPGRPGPPAPRAGACRLRGR
jgi:subfamily B ATP-binding cassette protein MsbA